MQPDECFGPGASVLCTDHDILYFVHKKRHHAGPARAKTVTGRPDRLGLPAKGSPCNPLSAGCVSGLPIFLPSLSTLVAVTTFSGPSGPSGPFIHINLYERVFLFLCRILVQKVHDRPHLRRLPAYRLGSRRLDLWLEKVRTLDL